MIFTGDVVHWPLCTSDSLYILLNDVARTDAIAAPLHLTAQVAPRRTAATNIILHHAAPQFTPPSCRLVGYCLSNCTIEIGVGAHRNQHSRNRGQGPSFFIQLRRTGANSNQMLVPAGGSPDEISACRSACGKLTKGSHVNRGRRLHRAGRVPQVKTSEARNHLCERGMSSPASAGTFAGIYSYLPARSSDTVTKKYAGVRVLKMMIFLN